MSTLTPLTAQVVLNADDYTLQEIGAQMNLTAARSWLGRGDTATNIFKEPSTGTVMLMPKQNFTDYGDPVLTDWTLGSTGSDWELLGASPVYDGKSGIFHRNIDSFARVTATSATAWRNNPSCMIGLYLHKPDDEDDDYVELTWAQDKTYPITLRIGNGYSPEIDFDGKTYVIDTVNPVTALNFHRQPLRLWVFFLRNYIIVHSNFMESFHWCPPQSSWANPTWTDDGDHTHVYLAEAGKFRVSACGMFSFSAVQNLYEVAGSYRSQFGLPYTPTVAPTLVTVSENFDKAGSTASVTGTLRKADDSDAYETGDASGSVKVVMASSDGVYSPYIFNYQVKWPPVSAQKTGAPVYPDVDSIQFTNTWDTGADTAVIKFFDDGTLGELDLRANMRVAIGINGYGVFSGNVDEPSGETFRGDRWFTLHMRDRFSRLQNAMLFTEFNADSMAPEDAIMELIYLAGVPDSDIICDTPSGYQLPTSGSQVEPAMLFLAGANILECIMQIKESWLADWRFYCNHDGYFVLEPADDTTLLAKEIKRTFIKGSDDVPADLDLVIRGDIRRWVDSTDTKNYILVLGVDSNLNPVYSVLFDTLSTTDEDYENFIGEIRTLVYTDVTLQTQAQTDLIAAKLKSRWGHVYRYYHFQIKYDAELYVGDMVAITGEGIMVITDIDSTIEKRFGTMTLTCRYMGEIPS
jgi:hypothetical protein